METIPSMAPVVRAPAVQERQAGGRGDAAAFRRALQQHHGDGADQPPAHEPGTRRDPAARGLQKAHGIDRNGSGEALHVDVIA